MITAGLRLFVRSFHECRAHGFSRIFRAPTRCRRGGQVIEPALTPQEWREDLHSDGAWQQLGGDIEDRALICQSKGWLVLDGERAKLVAASNVEPRAGSAAPGVRSYDKPGPVRPCNH